MALKKEVPSDYGIPATYIRIISVKTNWAESQVEVVLIGHANEEARRAGKTHLISANAKFPFERAGDQPTRGKLYDLLKQDPAFLGAEDC